MDPNSLGNLGMNSQVPAGYNTPDFGVGDMTQAGINPDQALASSPIDAIASTSFSSGGIDDPLDEYTAARDNPSGYSVNANGIPPVLQSPSTPQVSQMREDEGGFGYDADDVVAASDIAEANGFDNETPAFGESDEVPAFTENEDYPSDSDIVDNGVVTEDELPIDEDGALTPYTVEQDIEEEDLGEIPDVDIPDQEPILEIDDDDIDVELPDIDDTTLSSEPVPYTVEESFLLPENGSCVVSKGDKIYVIGKIKENIVPQFAETTFSRAARALAESLHETVLPKTLKDDVRVAVAGRSMLVEVAKDWKLPGTDVIFEKNDLLQIVSSKPVKTDEDPSKVRLKTESASDEQKEKARREAAIAYKRWREADRKRCEAEGKEVKDDDDSKEGDKDDKQGDKGKKDNDKKDEGFL